MLSTNQILHKGRYRVINQFTTDQNDGMYEAYDTVSDSNVVLKECVGSQPKVSTPSQREASDAAFFGVAKVLTKIKHDSLVNVQGYFSEIGQQYLVLERVEGFDLNKFLDPTAQRPDLKLVLKWADQLLGALHFLHKLSPPVIHGDIRPENIRFTSNEHVKLLTADVDAIPNASAPRAPKTHANSSGNVNYQPLEQFWPGLDASSQQSLLKDYDERSERILLQRPDARSDIYSLGACLYHVLTGVLPTDALDRSTALREGKPDPLQKPNEIVNDIPVEISDTIMKAMEIRREWRFYSAVVMAQVLRTAVVKAAERNSEEADEKQAEPAILMEPEESSGESVELLDSDSAQARLERERIKTDERQRELEAEQLRLEEEQKRLEERRQAIEAEKEHQVAERKQLELAAELERQKAEQERRVQEKKRLEAEAEGERLSATKRLAEIEAEQEKRRAEAERLEREAEEERKRAEQRLSELHAEQERLNTQELLAAAAVKEELQRAEQRLLELSNLDVAQPLPTAPDQIEETLLELETGSPSAAAASEAFELLDDESFMKPESAKTNFDSEFDFQGLQQPSKVAWKVPAIAAAVALVIVVTAVVWISTGSVEDPTSRPLQTSVTVPESNSQPATNAATTDQPVIDQNQSVVSEIPASDPTTPTQDVSGDPTQISATTDPKRPKASSVAPDKAKKPAPAKPAPKKVTVDDLINDN